MSTKKTPSRKSGKKPTKPARSSKKAPKPTNRQTLENAGIIDPDYEFEPADAAAIESLTNQEVNVLIAVFNDLGAQFFEDNSPNGFVFYILALNHTPLTSTLLLLLRFCTSRQNSLPCFAAV